MSLYQDLIDKKANLAVVGLGIGVSAAFHVSLQKFSNLVISEFPHIINFTQIRISSQKL